MRTHSSSNVTLLFATLAIAACGQTAPGSQGTSEGESSDAGPAVVATGADAGDASTAPRNTVQTGAACAHDFQCQTGLCSANEGTACGTCQEIRFLGESCGVTANTSCSRSALCANGACISTKKAKNEACRLGAKGESDDCDDELYCKGDGDASAFPSTGVCAARPRLGESCVTSNFAATCVLGLACERGVCTAKGEAHLGESCDNRTCTAGLFCREADTTCQPATLPLGADCGSLLGVADCVQNTRCELTGEGSSAPYPMKCLAGRALGAECASSFCAADLVCFLASGASNFTCVPPRNEGETCSGYDVDCASGLECRAGTCKPACT
jgi:hypothetical protein